MDNEIKIKPEVLMAIYNTLDHITVSGFDNIDKMQGLGMILKQTLQAPEKVGEINE